VSKSFVAEFFESFSMLAEPFPFLFEFREVLIESLSQLLNFYFLDLLPGR
jgi:hypothetical protein